MNKLLWSLDPKSLIIGFLFAIIAGLLFVNAGRSISAANGSAIAADESSGYIMVDGSVRYIEKQKCRQGAGCNFSTQ